MYLFDFYILWFLCVFTPINHNIGVHVRLTPRPPEFSTIKLTSDNFNEYISVNFSFFDYEMTTSNGGEYKYDIRVRMEISTTPRQPNLLFSEASIFIMRKDGFLTDCFFYPTPNCQLDSNGFSSVSCYVSTHTNWALFVPDISLDTLKIYPSGYVKVQII